jgi:hypothetical protein
MLIDAIRYIVLAEGSFASPLIKTARMVRFIAKKHRISIERSDLEAGFLQRQLKDTLQQKEGSSARLISGLSL